MNRKKASGPPSFKGYFDGDRPMTVAEIKYLVRLNSDWKCAECGMPSERHKRAYGRDLEVHRINPGSAYTVEGCVALCCPCHYKKPKSPYGSSPSGVVKLPGELVELVRILALREERTVGNMVVIAVKTFLKQQGLWPPPPPDKPNPPPPKGGKS